MNLYSPDKPNITGWGTSNMRETILGNSGTPSSPPTKSLLAILPAELRAVLMPVTKYTDNKGGGTSAAGNITATTDYLWLLAEFEVIGETDDGWRHREGNNNERYSQLPYDYFKAGNSREVYKHNETSSDAYVWLRSPSN